MMKWWVGVAFERGVRKDLFAVVTFVQRPK